VSIYKPCDIRGNATTELSGELYQHWGRVLGQQIDPGRSVVVGGDVRGSTPRFLEALVAGLCDASAEVIDLGLLPTPMIYFAKRHLKAAGCAIVTASHNPAEINGLKWMIGDRPPTEQEVQGLKQPAEPPAIHKPEVQPNVQDVQPQYVAWLKSTSAPTAKSDGMHVVVDPMYGCWAGRAVSYLKEVFPKARFSAIHDEPQGDFGGRSPDCSRPQRLEMLSRAVQQERAELGVAFDGDGDRVAFVDDQGTPFSPEQATCVLLQSFGDELAAERFVGDLKFSDRVAEAAAALGAEPLRERSGHAFIRTRMLQTAARFGAEISGHYFFGELEGGDDGLVAACRMIDYLARSGKTANGLRGECPAIYMTADLRLPVRPHHGQELIEHLRAAFSEYPQTTIDGVRVDFPHGWALIRPSVTEPALTFRFEASDDPSLYRLVRRFCDALGETGKELWARYEASREGRG